jgi:hypothetical protein
VSLIASCDPRNDQRDLETEKAGQANLTGLPVDRLTARR